MKKRNSKSTPLVVANEEWADAIPAWLREEVQSERVVQGLVGFLRKDDKKDSAEVGDAEALAYLMPASLSSPFDHDMTQIYLHLSGKVLKRANRVNELPKDLEVKELTDSQQRTLNDLKRQIYQSRGGRVRHPLLDVMSQFAGEAGSRETEET